MINKRAQEEIVGFVIIVLLVCVVGLILFGISLRKTQPVESSTRVENYVNAMVGVTTNCSIKKTPTYLEISELIKECKKGSSCYDGISACKSLNETISGIMNAAFDVNQDTPTTYYSIRMYYAENATESPSESQRFYNLEKGKCEGIKSGSTQSISHLPGIIRIETQICQQTIGKKT